jgi:hypothetical protein
MSTPDGLATALYVAAHHGWAPLPLVPWTKEPVNKGLFDNPPRTESEIRAAWDRAQRTIDRLPQHAHLRGLPPNIGILLGASKLLLLDADTPGEVNAWKRACGEHFFDPGTPTVRSPGTRGTDGGMKHIDGGHWYFEQPDDLVIPTKIVVHVKPQDSTESAILFGGRHLVVIPPSVRDTGAYDYAGGLFRPLPPFLRSEVDSYLTRFSRPHAGYSGSSDDPFGTSEYRSHERELDWDDNTDWLDVLPEGWTETAEDQDGHVVYARPGASSSRSAVAHPPGCRHFPNPNSPPPITFFSSASGDFLDKLQEGRGRSGVTSATKLRLYALQHFHGDMDKARESLGIPSPRRMSEAEARRIPAPAPLSDLHDAQPVVVVSAVPVDSTPVSPDVIDAASEPVPVGPDNPFAALRAQVEQEAEARSAAADNAASPASPTVGGSPARPPVPEQKGVVRLNTEQLAQLIREGNPKGFLDTIPELAKDRGDETTEALVRALRSPQNSPRPEAAKLPLDPPVTSNGSAPQSVFGDTDSSDEAQAEMSPPESETTETTETTETAETAETAETSETSEAPEPENIETSAEPEPTPAIPPKKATRTRKKPVVPEDGGDAPAKPRRAPRKKAEPEPEPEDTRVPVTDPPPAWNPVPIYDVILDVLSRHAKPLTAADQELVEAVENRETSFATRAKVVRASHVTTSEVAAELGIDVGRTHAVLRGLIPVLRERFGIILRERLLNEDPFQFGARNQKPEDVAWAVWTTTPTDPA